jgi:hypothetical protein
VTKAGAVLLDASRAVLSLVDHEVDRTRQVAGLGRPRLRVVMPPELPDALAVEAATALRSAAAAADVDLDWMEAPCEPDVWIPSAHSAAHCGIISLAELARMAVIHGPRRAEPVTYDAWAQVLRTVNQGFEFIDPPLRHSLPMDLAFAAAADRPTAVLTGPSVSGGRQPKLIRLPRTTANHELVLVGLEDRPLTATAALVWNGDLPRALQQILFDAADGIVPLDPAWPSATRARPEVARSLPIASHTENRRRSNVW